MPGVGHSKTIISGPRLFKSIREPLHVELAHRVGLSERIHMAARCLCVGMDAKPPHTFTKLKNDIKRTRDQPKLVAGPLRFNSSWLYVRHTGTSPAKEKRHHP